MTPLPSTPHKIVRRALLAISTVVGFGLAAMAFLTSLQNSLASG